MVQIRERSTRSVHREYCRPQGKRASLKQFSSVKKIKADGDGFNVRGSQNREIVKGEISEGLPESKSVACSKRSIENLGDPVISSKKVG